MSFARQERNGVLFHTADALTEVGGVVHGFSTRWGGVSQGDFANLNLGTRRGDDPAAVRENYHRFCTAVGVDEKRMVFPHQVHEDEIREATGLDVVRDPCDPVPYEADGLITSIRGLALFVYYADCIPVLFYDPKKKVIAVCHSGWRGTAKGIAPQVAIKMVRDYGCQMENIIAVIGPGICAHCFETHMNVPAAMEHGMGPMASVFSRPLPGGKYQFDLKGMIEFSLLNVGVRNISVMPLCTSCWPDFYWSHRRLGDRRGNQAAVIQLV